MRKLSSGDKKFFISSLLLFFIVLFFFPKTRVFSLYDRMSMKKFTSADGNFSIDIPTRWRRARRAPRFDDGKVYLSIEGAVWGGPRRMGSGSKRLAYASVTVAMTTLPPDNPIPSPQALGEDLNVRWDAAREAQAQAVELVGSYVGELSIGLPAMTFTGFEVKSMKGYQWAKTTLVTESRTYIFWQVVTDKSHHYTITLITNNISNYGPVFDKMLKSFSFNTR